MPIDYSGLPLPKGTPRIVDRIRTKMERDRAARACRIAVKRREDGKCRACGRLGTEMHHLVRRSRGGPWLITNVVLLCLKCHQFAHAALLQIRGNPEPGELLTIVGTGDAATYLARGPAWR